MDDKHEIYRIVQSFRQVNKTLFQVFWHSDLQLELTSVQYLVLSILHERPDIGLAELAKLANMGSSTMSGVVERLCKGGYITRARLMNDRRSLTLNLTAEGEDVRERIDTLWMERVSSILEIPKEDLDFTLQVHQQIVQKLREKGMTQREQSPNC
ncbi:MarR family winged helix-turn-helix transcriptional regulator [Paenibacillus jiagnxiensis]|uniref:MarR family winged helix-turn-helix transcriptional regulator n=1 Tax=Paenibacillus jiagnxiensis TaxID=3228926 RepID=UPI0033B2A667